MLNTFKQAPFYLDEQAIKWVKDTYKNFTTEQKIGQLFNLMVMQNSPDELAMIKKIQPGAITKFVTGSLETEINTINKIRHLSNTPLLISSDLEGGSMSFSFGAQVPNQLALAGLNDKKAVDYCTNVIAQEAKLLGINWSFTPVIDINKKFKSAIVGTRSYGSDIHLIKSMSQANIKILQQNNIAATVKHWPGEGFDDRDQHLVTTVNPMTKDQWDQSFGKLYQSAINNDVKAVMSAHIALPQYTKLYEDNQEQWWRPASINKHLNQTLLRDELGFNGLVVSDASTMAGVSSFSNRETVCVETIENGCDMLLFCQDPLQDFDFLLNGLRNGQLSEARLEQSVLRILAMKASLNLHHPSQDLSVDAFKQLTQSDYAKNIKKINRSTPHLVKNKSDFLPITVESKKRVLIISEGIKNIFSPHPIPLQVNEMLIKKGFEVVEFKAGISLQPENYDWILYLFSNESGLLKSRIYIDWLSLHAGFMESMYRPWVDLPTVMVSFGHPYLLYDAPSVPVYINAYCPNSDVQQAVVDALVGEINFNDQAAIDPFCGLDQLKY
ncbi:glycoside hydrolase family 3 protein [Marinicellulosiphila megalodicopiae]|uniref:glycoside hydrolase family 3 protein n=1 Tax=Marinicellulosiphila megalodicopiae TaxID=2724896 RepID=UPI003BB1B9E3